jgi:phosphoglycerate dehydrogenase-like enzyme
VGADLQGKTLGVIGLGDVGTRIARVGLAFGMEVIAWSHNLTGERAASLGARYVSKDELLESSDIVSVHTNLSARTVNLLRFADLQKMKRTAYLVNTARGPIVEESALIRALQEDVIAGAALDVYDVEPLPVDHPLRTLPNTLLTPHLGYVTEDNYRLFFTCVVEDIRAWLAGSPIRELRHLPQVDRSL